MRHVADALWHIDLGEDQPNDPHSTLADGDESSANSSAWLPRPTRTAVEIVEMSQLDYEIAGREAHCYGFEGGEFLRVELYDGYFSIHWTTALPLAAVLERVGPLLRNIDGEAVVFDERTRAHETLGVGEAIGRMRADDATLSFARLELPEVTFVWEQAVADGATAHGELALMARLFDEDTCVRVLRETATNRVAHEATALIGRLTYVADHIGRGELASASAEPTT